MLVLVGRLVPLLQALFENYRIVVLFLLLTRRGNNILILRWFEVIFRFLVLGFYVTLIYLFIVDITRIGYINVHYELVYIIIGFPGGLPFYIKVFSLYLVSNLGGVIFILVLVGLLLNILGGYNLLVNINSSSHFSGKISLYIFLFLAVFLIL